VTILDLEQKLDIGLAVNGRLDIKFILFIFILNNEGYIGMAQFDIEEILHEAHAYGLREDVLRVAKWLIDNNTFHDISVAYDLAYQHCTEQIDAT
jgi:hypothetical protein